MYFQAWRKYFDFLGVATRSEYWTFTLINLAIHLLLAIVTFSTGTVEDDMFQPNIVVFAWIAFAVLTIIPALTVAIRRVRDATGTGLWLLIGLLPFVGGIVVLVMTLMPTKKS